MQDMKGESAVQKKKIMTAAIAALLGLTLLAGCASSAESGNTTAPETAGGASASAIAADTGTVDVIFDSSDHYFDWQSGSYTTLDMSAGSQTVAKSGTYEITGTLNDGSLIIDVDKSADKGTVYLVLNNVSITSETSAPIDIKDAEKVVLVLENETVNTVTQGSGVVVNSDNEPSAAVFSKADLTITGGGALTVVSDYNDGITCKDTLKITGGTLYVQAKSDGITGKDLLAVETSDITVTAGKDGMRSTNDTDADRGSILIKDGVFDIHAANDAIQAYRTLQIDGGSFDLTSGGGYAGTISTDTGFGKGEPGGYFPQPGNQAGTDPAFQTGTDDDATQIADVGGMTGAPGINSDSPADSASDSASDSKKCLKADGAILINGGSFLISSYEDALNSSGDIVIGGGTLTLSAGDDGIRADADVSLSGGTVTIHNSYEGIEGSTITVNNGELTLNASDDGFNVNDGTGLQTIGGGSVYINAGGDGLDSNGSVTMTGGTVYVDGPTNNGNGAIDYAAVFTISGGTLVATGSSGMAQTPGMSSSQPSILMYYATPQAAGTAVTVRDESGNTVATFTPAKAYSSAAISAPGLKTGQTYTLTSGETDVVTFTISDTVTYLNESGVTTSQGMMMPGGQMPGGQMPGGQMPGGQIPDGQMGGSGKPQGGGFGGGKPGGMG
jgi:hypothetical protein